MAKIEELTIECFRGVKNLTLKNLKAVNLIIGDNNCGKTSVLEAVQFFRNPLELSNFIRTLSSRNQNLLYSFFDDFIYAFPHADDNKRIKVDSIIDGKNASFEIYGKQQRAIIDKSKLKNNRFIQNRLLTDSFENIESDVFYGKIINKFDGNTSTSDFELYRANRVFDLLLNKKNAVTIEYIPPYGHFKVNLFNKILKNDDYKEKCIHALQMFDQNIENIAIYKSEDNLSPVEYIKYKDLGDMPVFTCGDGIKRVLTLSDAIIKSSNGILLIDEIETSIHKKYYDSIFKFVVIACKQYNVQLFITTHSIEAIDAILNTQDYNNQNENDDISVITLKKDKNTNYSRLLSGREVYKNREAFDFEVRL